MGDWRQTIYLEVNLSFRIMLNWSARMPYANSSLPLSSNLLLKKHWPNTLMLGKTMLLNNRSISYFNLYLFFSSIVNFFPFSTYLNSSSMAYLIFGVLSPDKCCYLLCYMDYYSFTNDIMFFNIFE
jgi:hypothetical protein